MANPRADLLEQGTAQKNGISEPETATSSVVHSFRSRRRLWRLLLGGVPVCLAGIGVWVLLGNLPRSVPVLAISPTPVLIALAQTGDVPAYLTGLGSVQAHNTVTLHVRMDGVVGKVVFIEGQDVKAGDLPARIDYASIQLRYTAITSPIAGRTGVRLIDTGNIVHAPDTSGSVVITQIQPISILFTLSEDDFGRVNRQSTTGPLSVVALGRMDNRIMGRGMLALVNNRINPATSRIPLKAIFEKNDPALWPGQFVAVRLRPGVSVKVTAASLSPS